jgi:signal recognition particle receptor subunit beta
MADVHSTARPAQHSSVSPPLPPQEARPASTTGAWPLLAQAVKASSPHLLLPVFAALFALVLALGAPMFFHLECGRTVRRLQGVSLVSARRWSDWCRWSVCFLFLRQTPDRANTLPHCLLHRLSLPSLHPAIARRRRVAGLASTAKRGSPSGPVILIAGPPGAGKTALFLRLRDGPAATVAAGPGPRRRAVHLVDAPGHPRLRALSASHAPGAAALIFVVDAAEFLGGKADAADQLVGLVRRLGTKARRRGRGGRDSGGGGGPPILLACNKADLGAAAHSPDFIRKRLEREVEAGRAAAGGTLAARADDDDDDSGGDARRLCPPSQAFTFDGLAAVGGGRLAAVACAAGSGDVSRVEAWLAEIVS